MTLFAAFLAVFLLGAGLGFAVTIMYFILAEEDSLLQGQIQHLSSRLSRVEQQLAHLPYIPDQDRIAHDDVDDA